MRPLKKHAERRSWTPDQWTDWTLRVFRGNGGMLYVNEYEERRGSLDLRRGIRHAMKRGLVKCEGGPPARKWYSLTALAAGKETT